MFNYDRVTEDLSESVVAVTTRNGMLIINRTYQIPCMHLLLKSCKLEGKTPYPCQKPFDQDVAFYRRI